MLSSNYNTKRIVRDSYGNSFEVYTDSASSGTVTIQVATDNCTSAVYADTNAVKDTSQSEEYLLIHQLRIERADLRQTISDLEYNNYELKMSLNRLKDKIDILTEAVAMHIDIEEIQNTVDVLLKAHKNKIHFQRLMDDSVEKLVSVNNKVGRLKLG